MESNKKILSIRPLNKEFIVMYDNNKLELLNKDELHGHISCEILEYLNTYGYYIHKIIYSYTPYIGNKNNDGVKKIIVYNEDATTYDCVLILTDGFISFPNYDKNYIKENYELNWSDVNLDFIENI